MKKGGLSYACDAANVDIHVVPSYNSLTYAME